MKIAVYKDNLSTGRGADKAVRNFADGLSERGYRVSLFEKPELEARIDEAFDVFVATGSNEIVDLDRAGYFERPGRARVVLQLHLAPRGFFKWKHPFRNRAVRKAFNKADVIQILCSDYERELRAFAPDPRIFVIGNWSEASAPMENSPPGDSRIVLYPAASLNKIKNQKLLIRAFASIAEKHPEWKVRLLGKDTTRYAGECRRLVRSLKMEGRIEMPGLVRDVVSEYSAASFVAFPSILEGFPLAVLEAAAFGHCTLAVDSLPGVTDMISNGETGIISRNDVKTYAAAMEKMMTDAACRKKLGENARIHCRRFYSREKILDKWEALLHT